MKIWSLSTNLSYTAFVAHNGMISYKQNANRMQTASGHSNQLSSEMYYTQQKAEPCL